MVTNTQADFLIFINRFFKTPKHPFNMSNAGVMSYAQWQFERGADTVSCYDGWRGLKGRELFDAMFDGKETLDVGCGAAGKSIYYAANGAKSVVGIDTNADYRKQALALAKEKGCEHKFSFVKTSASDMSLADDSFDTVIMNDTMEHVDLPVRTMRECLRVLRTGGRLFMNFPPYGHPYGAHVSDAIGIPWIQYFVKEDTLGRAYSSIVRDLPDGQRRFNMRFSVDYGYEAHNTYINKMTIKRFLHDMSVVEIMSPKGSPVNLDNHSNRPPPLIRYNLLGILEYYKEIPLRNFLKIPAKIPGIKEGLVRMVVAVIEKIEPFFLLFD